MNLDTQRRKFNDCLSRNDENGLREVLKSVIDELLTNDQLTQRITELLDFWKKICRNNYDGFEALFLAVYNDKKQKLQANIQRHTHNVTALEQALSKQQQWLEKLIMITNVLHLQADPRHQTEIQIEQIRLNLDQVQQEAAQLKQALHNQVAQLREQL